ncbi:MAG: hypothetical protein MUF14_04680 [Hyphomonadaceae bacterium]|jgi:DNA-directed RNA polymerase subunit RPC12/RpoP|nr:hypothetical protein [Hyphomonadaceae bacterium]
MPQYDMILLTPQEAAGADILMHTAGSPLKQGGGDETHRCGRCKTKLLVSVAHADAHDVVVRCGKCGSLNTEPHHHHH